MPIMTGACTYSSICFRSVATMQKSADSLGADLRTRQSHAAGVGVGGWRGHCIRTQIWRQKDVKQIAALSKQGERLLDNLSTTLTGGSGNLFGVNDFLQNNNSKMARG